MTTNQDIVVGAMRYLSVLAAGQDADANEAVDNLRALNDMMLAMPAKGIHTGWTEQTLSGTFPLEDKHIEGVKWLLARKIAPNHGITLSAEQRANVVDGYNALEADYKILETLRLDDGLQNMPSQRRYWR